MQIIQSSPAGTVSSIFLRNLTLSSVTLSPFKLSWANQAATSRWTISREPLNGSNCEFDGS